MTGTEWTLELTAVKATTSTCPVLTLVWNLDPTNRFLLNRALSKAVEPHIKQEDEGKYRCKECGKLFKATAFVEKHIANKHGEVIKDLDLVSVSASPLLFRL